MSYPRQKDKFDAWHKAMVAGATVDKPNYGKGSNKSSRKRTSSKHRKRKRRRKKNAET